MKIKWGVLGTASIAKHCTIPGMLRASSCELYAIAGRNEAKVNEFKEQFGFEKGYVGYDKLIGDPEVCAVYIPLPNDIHKEWVIKCLRAKKHVLCEKPMALNAADAKEMYAIAKENGVILMEAFAYLHSPYVQALKEEVSSGALGKLLYIDTAFLTQGYHEDFRLHKEYGGGMVYDLGCYCTTMILSLIDDEVEWVKGIAEMTNEQVDALASAIIGFKNGARACFTVGMSLGIGTNARYDRLFVRGTKGSLSSDVEYNQEGELRYTVMAEGKKETRSVLAPSNYTLEIENLSRAVMGLEKPFVSEEFSVRNTELMDRILREIGY